MYDFKKNSFYSPRKSEKIHTEFDSDLDKRFKSFVSFWGSIGYLAWKYMVENNSKSLSSEQLEMDIVKMGNLYYNDKPLSEFFQKDKDNKRAKSELCKEMYKNLTEKDFTRTLNSFLYHNEYENIVAIKMMTPRHDSIRGIDSIEKLEKDRWMSFTILPNVSYKSVKNNPYNYLLLSSVGTTATFEYMIIEIPLNFKYIKTNHLCDLNEIIVNSSEIIENQKNMTFDFIKQQ